MYSKDTSSGIAGNDAAILAKCSDADVREALAIWWILCGSGCSQESSRTEESKGWDAEFQPRNAQKETVGRAGILYLKSLSRPVFPRSCCRVPTT